MKRILSYICLFFLTLLNLNVQAHNEGPVIHVFGDSHSLEFFQIPHCVIHHLGPITMHRVGRDGLSFLYLPNLGVLEGEVAVFSFGEIDARCHIGRQRDLFNRSQDEVIETLAYNYLYTLVLNRMLYRKLTLIVYSVTPPTDCHYNPAYPFYGSVEDRVAITKQLNRRLKQLCRKVGIEFLDVYADYANPDGTLNLLFHDGTVHIDWVHNQAISKKLYQILLK
jgi:hypothetical protein